MSWVKLCLQRKTMPDRKKALRRQRTSRSETFGQLAFKTTPTVEMWSKKSSKSISSRKAWRIHYSQETRRGASGKFEKWGCT